MAPKELFEGQVETLDCLLEGLRVDLLEKGVILFQLCKEFIEVVPGKVCPVVLVGCSLGFQGPIIDEPTGVGGFPNAQALSLIRVQAIPKGPEHIDWVLDGLFEVRVSSSL